MYILIKSLGDGIEYKGKKKLIKEYFHQKKKNPGDVCIHINNARPV